MWKIAYITVYLKVFQGTPLQFIMFLRESRQDTILTSHLNKNCKTYNLSCQSHFTDYFEYILKRKSLHIDLYAKTSHV